jgi:hypothetical protein
MTAASMPSKTPASQQQHLAAAALLGRRADHDEPARQLGHQRRQGEAGAGPHGGDHVVAAGVAHARQRVVLAQHGDGRPGRRAVALGPEGGRQAAHAALDREAARLQGVGQPAARPHLLEQDLGVGVDPVRELDQGRGLALELGVDAGGEVGHGVLRGAAGVAPVYRGRGRRGAPARLGARPAAADGANTMRTVRGAS